MADKIARKEGHRQVFEDHVNEIAETSKNASFLSDEDFLEIVKFLKGQNSKWSHSRSLGTRIQKHSYRLLDYPALGLKEVLCKPLDKTDAAVCISNSTF